MPSSFLVDETECDGRMSPQRQSCFGILFSRVMKIAKLHNMGKNYFIIRQVTFPVNQNAMRQIFALIQY